MVLTLMKSDGETTELEDIEAEIPEPVHLVWEDDENESLCGLDVSNMAWEQSTEPVTICSACLEARKFVEELEEKLNGE